MRWSNKSTLFLGALLGAAPLSAAYAGAQTGPGPKNDPRAENPVRTTQERLADFGYAPVSTVRTNYQLLQSRLQTAKQELSRTQDLYKAGQVPQGEVAKAEADVAQLSIQCDKASKDLELVEFRAKLQQPVNIQLDHASVRQFATALTKATGIAVGVDRSIPQDASALLTLDAQQVPFGNVLEAIAEKTDLMISQDNSNGVVLKRWPRINDRVLRSPIAPWGQEWGAPPTMGAGFNPLGANPAGNQEPDGFRRGLGGDAAAGLPAGGGQFGAGQPDRGFPGMGDPNARFQPGMPGMAPGMPGGAPFQMASLGGNAIVIAEPGHDRQGNPGVWMTAYRFGANNQFARISSMFHPFMNGNGPAGGPPPGAGGFQPGGGVPVQPPGPQQRQFLQPTPGTGSPQPGAGGSLPPRGQPRSSNKPRGGGLPPGNLAPPDPNKPADAPPAGDALPGTAEPPAVGDPTKPRDTPAGADEPPAVGDPTKPVKPRNESNLDALLLNAIKQYDLASVQSLLKKGANPNVRLPYVEVKDKSQQFRQGDELTALVIAIDTTQRSEPLVRALLDQGANPNLRFNEGGTPLMEAACRGSLKILQALLDDGADINAKANDGATALMYAVRFGRADAARLLIEKGANINARRDDGATALMDAIAFGDFVDVVKTLLVIKGIEVNAADKTNYTALDVANKYSRKEMIALLKKAGAKQNKPTPKPDPRQFFGEGLAYR